MKKKVLFGVGVIVVLAICLCVYLLSGAGSTYYYSQIDNSKIEQTEIAGKKVFNVADNFLIACFDANVTEETITAIAKQQPYYFVMRDSSLANDSVAANFDQIFAAYSPDTVRKVL